MARFPAVGVAGLEPLPVELRDTLLSLAARKAVEHAGSPGFHRHVDTLAEEPIFGTFLRISNGYFETGYSDPGLFEDLAREHQYVLRASELNDAAGKLMDKRLFNPLKAWRLARLLEKTGGYLDAAEALSRYDSRDLDGDPAAHPLARLDLPADLRFEVNGAAQDLVRNLAAALFYAYVARIHGAGYLPHPLRAPLASLALAGDEPSEVAWATAKSTMDGLRLLRAERAARLNQRLPARRAPYVDVEFPFVLAAILEGCRSRDEFAERLAELRDSKAASRFRRWFADLHEALGEGGLSMTGLDRRLAGLDDAVTRAAAEFGVEESRTPFRVTIGLNLGVVSMQTELKRARRKRPPRQLRILMDFARISNANPALGRLLRPAFGDEVAAAWSSSQTLLASIAPAGASPAFDLR